MFCQSKRILFKLSIFVVSFIGGQIILEECKDYIKRNGPLAEVEIFTSSPSNLKCRAVIHAVGSILDKSRSTIDDILKKCVHSILLESKIKKIGSVAIPALCCGASNYPPDKATNAIIISIQEYFKNTKSTVKTLYLCDIAPRVTDLFVTAADNVFKRADESPVNDDFSHRIGSGIK